MFYWILGIVLFIVLVDFLILKPLQKEKWSKKLKNRLYKKSVPLPEWSRDRGIVTVIDKNTILAVSFLILSLKHLGCLLPILIFSEKPLKEESFLKSLGNVEIKYVGQGEEPLMRAIAIIGSPFREVLYLDPRAVLLVNPEYLFSSREYQQTGTLFWKEKETGSPFYNRQVWSWIKDLVPYEKEDNAILSKKSGRYQSGNILLLNKKIQEETLQKLWTLNKNWRNSVVDTSEYYWLAAELARKDYSFVPSYPGVIGRDTSQNVVCGDSLFLDPFGQLLCFFNERQEDFTSIDRYALFKEESEWVPSGFLSHHCLKDGILKEIDLVLKKLLNYYTKILHDLRIALVYKGHASKIQNY